MPQPRGAAKYQEGEPVLCFQVFTSNHSCWMQSKKFSYSALFQGGLIYEAKVQALQKEEGVTLYRIHYKVTFLPDSSFNGYNQYSHELLIRAGTRHGMNVCLRTGF